jgi:hypothetical protein
MSATAKELHLLDMATWPVCEEMAHAMMTAGVADLNCFRGLSFEACKRKMLLCFSFSRIQIRRIHAHVNKEPAPAPPSDSRTYLEMLCSPHQSLFPPPPFLATELFLFPPPPFLATENPKPLLQDYRRSRADATEWNVDFLKRKLPEGSPTVGLFLRSLAKSYRTLGDKADDDACRYFKTYPCPMSEKSLHEWCRYDARVRDRSTSPQ